MQLMLRKDTENGRDMFGGGNIKPLYTCPVLSAHSLHLLRRTATVRARYFCHAFELKCYFKRNIQWVLRLGFLDCQLTHYK